jgi:hypothetical protein
MTGDGGRSGIAPWLLLGAAVLWFRGSDRRRGATQRSAPDAERFMQRITIADGREVLQVQAVIYEPEPNSTEQWVHVQLDGSEANQEHLALTLDETGGAPDVVAVLVPLGTRRRVNAVDCYVAGGLAGHLPAWAVARWGDQLRAVHLARDGQPSAVHARIVREGDEGRSPHSALEVLMPEAFST